MTKDGWVLKLKEEQKDADMVGDYYYQDEEYAEFLTQDLNEATIIYSKEDMITGMKAHEENILKLYGSDALCNAGYTNMMSNFDWFEVEVEVIE